jgi:hypothetical protein
LNSTFQGNNTMKILGASDIYYAQLVARQKTPTAATIAERSKSVAVTAEKPCNSHPAGSLTRFTHVKQETRMIPMLVATAAAATNTEEFKSIAATAEPSSNSTAGDSVLKPKVTSIGAVMAAYVKEVDRIRSQESSMDRVTYAAEFTAANNEYRAQMKAIENTPIESSDSISFGRRLYCFGSVNQFGAVNGIPIKIVGLGTKEAAELAQKYPDPAEYAAAYEQRRVAEEHRINTTKSRDMHFANIEELPLEIAKMAVGIVQKKIDNHEDAGMNIRAHIGNQVVSDLNTYMAALKDYISKHDTVASQPNAKAVSVYGQVQDMAPKEA